MTKERILSFSRFFSVLPSGAIRKASSIFLLAVLLLPLSAEQFRFKYNQDEKYRILSTVNETVRVNGTFANESEIINRISVHVTDASPDGRTGTQEAVFMTSENARTAGSTEKRFIWGDEYTSVFTSDEFGHYIIDDEYLMPVVRNEPVFPERDLKAGDTWEGQGEEVHDMRASFGVAEPLRVPFDTFYTYMDVIERDGKTLHVIQAESSIFCDIPVPRGIKEDYPCSMMEYAEQTIFWDNDRGVIDSYSEEFRIVLETRLGNIIEYAGSASAEYTSSEDLSAPEVLSRVQETLEDLQLEDASLSADDKGITVSLENIQFKADSAVLLPSEKGKLIKLGKLLEAFPGNDLLISGHTARAGSEEACQTLSEERAQAVGAFLEQLGVRDAYHIFTRGFGSTMPVADNSTEAGKSRNRRVEITILQ